MSITVASLTKIYGTQKAVNNISFSLKKGQIVGFLGPNGAGKSTTMKMITGYLPPTEGKITVCGFDVQEQPLDVRRNIGYLPEANPLYTDMYVREYLEFTAGIHKLGRETKSRIDEMINLTGLNREAHKKIQALSKGYKQRVGLAQAMIHRPEVLILDEPTSGLDPNQIVEIRELILQIGREKTVLLSTHIMQEVQAMCSRVMIINNGNIVADDTIDNLRRTSTENVLIVTLEKPVPETELQQLGDVRRVENTGNNTYKLITDKPELLRKKVMQWALQKDVNIRSLQEESHSLEEVFRNYTRTANEATPAPESQATKKK